MGMVSEFLATPFINCQHFMNIQIMYPSFIRLFVNITKCCGNYLDILTQCIKKNVIIVFLQNEIYNFLTTLVRSLTITVSGTEKRSPALDRSLFFNTCIKSSCIFLFTLSSVTVTLIFLLSHLDNTNKIFTTDNGAKNQSSTNPSIFDIPKDHQSILKNVKRLATCFQLVFVGTKL